ncbi:lytic transglycosylase domain-containing protein [Marinobacter salicampi]|uniref:lytic transglycosylase domain-containing protein n=1 Tax=Marinobacter salicampi TaxID=435907 RepID=UPI001408EF8E|nr:lytic transglycosylase domain-containing protein [Marinobacter salicampi]
MGLRTVSIQAFESLLFDQKREQNSHIAEYSCVMCFLVFFALFLPSPTAASEKQQSPAFLVGTVYERIAISENVSPVMLYALALTESGRAIGEDALQVAPWPYVLRALDARYYADNENDYRIAFKLFKERYGDKFDIGPLQVNSYWQVTRGKKVESDEELLDLEQNLRTGAQVLREAIESTDDIALGIGRYHTWSDNERARLFGNRVLSVQQNLLDSEN